jgi:hypothetical protein
MLKLVGDKGIGDAESPKKELEAVSDEDGEAAKDEDGK